MSDIDLEESHQEIVFLKAQNARLRAMVTELVEVYWGEGDSDPHNPPDIIKRAKLLLKS